MTVPGWEFQRFLVNARAVKVLYVHGLDSSGLAKKAQFIRTQVPELLSPDFQGPLEERMSALTARLGQDRWVLVGSSLGGLMATLWASAHPGQVERLILLAPALHYSFAPPATPLTFPTLLWLGKRDEIIPLQPVLQIARQSFADLVCHLVDDDHRLWPTCQAIDWKSILGLR